MRTSVGSVAGCPSCGSAWTKSAGRLRRAPHLFVERAVERDRRAFRRRDRAPAVRRLERQIGRGGKGTEEQGQCEYTKIMIDSS